MNNNNNIVSSDLLSIQLKDVDLEISEIYLNQEILNLISRKSNGIYYKYDKLDAFLDSVEFNKGSMLKSNRSNVISYSYFLFIFILLLSIEWYYRNKFGLI